MSDDNEFMLDTEFLAWLVERNTALLTLDLEWARRQLNANPRTAGRPINDEQLLTIMHKARLEITTMDPDARKESARWLQARGLKTMTHMEPDPENLPT
jgi:hypothetical protein